MSLSQETETATSEFGRGLVYCLGLFLAHAERFRYEKEMFAKLGISRFPAIWFNGASDHLYELEVDHAPETLQPRLNLFRDKVLKWGHGLDYSATEEDVDWAIDEAKTLLLLLDQANGINAVEASWK